MPKKIVLPPKPVPKTKTVPVAPVPASKLPTDISNLKAVDYAVTLEDGSVLRAKGEHADLIFRYLNECERHCAEHQLINYLGPSLARFDGSGRLLANGSTK